MRRQPINWDKIFAIHILSIYRTLKTQQQKGKPNIKMGKECEQIFLQ